MVDPDTLEYEQRRLVEIGKQVLLLREQTREMEAAHQRQIGRLEALREVSAQESAAESPASTDGLLG